MAGSHNKNVRQKVNASEVLKLDLIDTLTELESKKQSEGNDEFKDCYSTSELAEHIGKGIPSARRMVKKLIKNGLCEYAGKKKDVGIDGRPVNIPVYKFLFKNKKSPKVRR